MKSTHLRALRTWTIIILIAYGLLGVFAHEFVVHTNPGYLIIESVGDTESQIQSQDLQSAKINLRVALRDLDTLRHSKYELQIMFLLAILGIVGFSCWSLYRIGRIKREDSHDHAA
jgi:hypothetical protein